MRQTQQWVCGLRALFATNLARSIQRQRKHAKTEAARQRLCEEHTKTEAEFTPALSNWRCIPELLEDFSSTAGDRLYF